MSMRKYFIGLLYFLFSGQKTIVHDLDMDGTVVAVNTVMFQGGIISELDNNAENRLGGLSFCSKDVTSTSISRLLPEGLAPTKYKLLTLQPKVVAEGLKEKVIAKWFKSPTTDGITGLAGALGGNLNAKLDKLYQIASCIDLWKVASEASKEQIGAWIKGLIGNDRYLAGMLAVMYPGDINEIIGNDGLDVELRENHDLITSLNPLLNKGQYTPNLINFLLFAGVKPSSWTKLKNGYRFRGLNNDEFDTLCKNYVDHCLGIGAVNISDLEKINGQQAVQNHGIMEGILHTVKEFFWDAPMHALGYTKWCLFHNIFPRSAFNNILTATFPLFLVSFILICYPLTFFFANILCIVSIFWVYAVNFWKNRYKYDDSSLLVKEVWPNDV